MSIKYNGTAKVNYTDNVYGGEENMNRNYQELETIILNEEYADIQLWYENEEFTIDEVFDDEISKDIEFTGEGHIQFMLYKGKTKLISFIVKENLQIDKIYDSDVITFIIKNEKEVLGVRLLI